MNRPSDTGKVSKKGRRRGTLLLLSILFVTAACEEAALNRTDVVMPECTSEASTSARAPTAADTLDILVHVLDPTDTELLVRVDPVDDGTVTFPPDAPEGVAAAGLSLTTRGIFRVCVSANAIRTTFVADEAPFGKGWLRVTTDRPVRAILRLGDTDDPTASSPVVVRPGSSGRTGRVAPSGRVAAIGTDDARTSGGENR